MIANIQYNSRTLKIDISNPIDISISIHPNKKGVNAWQIEYPEIGYHQYQNQLIKVSDGATVNFNHIKFSPHSHITHTECVGHILDEVLSVNQELKHHFFLAEVITVAPENEGKDFYVSKKQLQTSLGNKKRDAVVIRTLPNLIEKKSKNYSKTNPVFLHEEAAKFLCDKQIEHLLIDVPSVDKEDDGGKLLAHKAFWNVGGEVRKNATITELIFVPNYVEDGEYLLNLMIAPFETDATPSKPTLYKIL